MKRVSRVLLLAIFGLLLLGSTNAYAGGKDNKNNQGDNNQENNKNNQGDNNQGNKNSQGDDGGGLINLIENLISDFFNDYNSQGNNQGNNQGSSGNPYTPTTTSGGGTAPIDGGISFLLIAGIGLGISKMAGHRSQA